jgi:flagellin
MPLNITTNTAALRASESLSKNQNLLQKSLGRLSSGRKVNSPVDDPGSLAVGMKLSASINRLAGAHNNVQNALSFLEVQDGLLHTAGQVVARMNELKGLASQDPMKGSQDVASYNNEFKDLQMQLFNLAQMTFNGVSLFANYTPEGPEALFHGQDQDANFDNTISIFTSTLGAGGAKVSIHKSLLLSALTLKMTAGRVDSAALPGSDKTNGYWSVVSARQLIGSDGTTTIADYSNLAISPTNDDAWVTLASESLNGAITLDMISSGVLESALENIAYLRAQNGGGQSRLSFNLLSLSQQKTNMSAALGRIVDTDIAEESSNIAKYTMLTQMSATILAQANSSTNIALMLIQ